MSAKKQISLQLAFTTGQPSIAFSSLDALEKWVKKEAGFWKWFGEVGQNPMSQFWSNTNHFHSQIFAAIDVYRLSKDDAHLQHIQSLLQQLGSKGIRLTSEDPRAQIAVTLAETNKTIGGFTVVAFVEPDRLPQNIEAMQGVIHAAMYDHAISKKGVSAHAKALKATASQWGAFVDGAKKGYQDFGETFRTLNEKIDQTHQDQESRFKKLVDQSERELSAIASTYDERLALQAPVQYWTKKASDHRALSKKFGWWFGVSFVAVLVALGLELGLWLLPALPVTSTDLPAYWVVVVFAASVTFALWPLRILSRLLLSNIHLRTDAEERVTLANTYLSLLRSEAGLEPDDRRLILEALFRRSSTGIVRDDAMPHTPISQLTRLVSGGK